MAFLSLLIVTMSDTLKDTPKLFLAKVCHYSPKKNLCCSLLHFLDESSHGYQEPDIFIEIRVPNPLPLLLLLSMVTFPSIFHPSLRAIIGAFLQMLLHHDYAASAASVLPRLALQHQQPQRSRFPIGCCPAQVTAQNTPCGTDLGAVVIVGHAFSKRAFSKSRAYAPPGQNIVGSAEASDSDISGRLV